MTFIQIEKKQNQQKSKILLDLINEETGKMLGLI